MLGFVVGVRDSSDVGKKFIKVGCRQVGSCWKVLEEFLCYDIDSLVGALGGKHDSHQELKCISVGQFGLCHGHVFSKMLDEGFVSLFFEHGCRGNIGRVKVSSYW